MVHQSCCSAEERESGRQLLRQTRPTETSSSNSRESAELLGTGDVYQIGFTERAAGTTTTEAAGNAVHVEGVATARVSNSVWSQFVAPTNEAILNDFERPHVGNIIQVTRGASYRGIFGGLRRCNTGTGLEHHPPIRKKCK